MVIITLSKNKAVHFPIVVVRVAIIKIVVVVDRNKDFYAILSKDTVNIEILVVSCLIHVIVDGIEVRYL